MNFSKELVLSQKQTQVLIHSPQMQKALHLLQMPVMDLSAFLEREIAENPILEFSEEERELEREEILRELASSPKFKKTTSKLDHSIENHLVSELTLFDFLMNQARLIYEEEELAICYCLIGNLDEDGFLKIDLSEIALLNDTTVERLQSVLQTIQTFDPPGIGATSLQESLLIQLRRQSKEKTLCYSLIQNHYDDLLRNRIPLIVKKTKLKAFIIKETLIREMKDLNFHPGAQFNRGPYTEVVHSVCPDVSIVGPDFKVVVNERDIPGFRLNPHYLSMLHSADLPKETKEYIQNKIISGKWLKHNLNERHNTLYRIAEQIVAIQKHFFSKQEGLLLPMTMKEVADKLSLHESTIARAVAHKYVDCFKGILPLRFFFTHAMHGSDGSFVSNHSTKQMVQTIIMGENKNRPFSDALISKQLLEKGFVCARRTVAKYREELGFGTVSQRKKHF